MIWIWCELGGGTIDRFARHAGMFWSCGMWVPKMLERMLESMLDVTWVSS